MERKDEEMRKKTGWEGGKERRIRMKEEKTVTVERKRRVCKK